MVFAIACVGDLNLTIEWQPHFLAVS